MLNWSASYSVGIKSLDAEHQGLFIFFNQLVKLASSTPCGAEVEQAFADYIQAAASHFASEEKLLERHRYPGLSKQRKDHQSIIARMQHHQERLKSGAATLNKTVLDEIGALKLNHILGPDQAYAEYLRGQGVS